MEEKSMYYDMDSVKKTKNPRVERTKSKVARIEGEIGSYVTERSAVDSGIDGRGVDSIGGQQALARISTYAMEVLEKGVEMHRFAQRYNTAYVYYDGEKDEVMACVKTLGRMSGVNFGSGHSKEEVESFLWQMREAFLLQYEFMLNNLMTPRWYAKFKGIPESTVRQRMASRKLTTITISGTVFIIVGEGEMVALGLWLTEQELTNEVVTKEQEELHERLSMVYELVKGEKPVVTPRNSVGEWTRSRGWRTSGERGMRKRIAIEAAYRMFWKWCKHEAIPEMTLYQFSKRVTAEGFRKAAVGTKRGVWYWDGMEGGGL